MKIGLFFGSFNPVHVGHLIIANHIMNETDLERVGFIVGLGASTRVILERRGVVQCRPRDPSLGIRVMPLFPA